MNPQPNDKILFNRVVKVLSYPLREYIVFQPIDMPLKLELDNWQQFKIFKHYILGKTHDELHRSL